MKFFSSTREWTDTERLAQCNIEINAIDCKINIRVKFVNAQWKTGTSYTLAFPTAAPGNPCERMADFAAYVCSVERLTGFAATITRSME